MSFIARLFRQDKTPQQLYSAILSASRQTALYQQPGGVPDTVEGRFELLCLHLWVLLRVLGQGSETGQTLFNIFCADLDASARELGVGDLSVGKKVKAMVAVFYGRALQYDAARTDVPSFITALQRALPELSDEKARNIALAIAGYEDRWRVVLAKPVVATVSFPQTLLETAAA
ncbi:MAG: ubiquinol-cytochrome C chaperone [Thalassospira sp.]|nr:ubiquinol-cytochrome C chaperone [Thalassospira sp.]